MKRFIFSITLVMSTIYAGLAQAERLTEGDKKWAENYLNSLSIPGGHGINCGRYELNIEQVPNAPRRYELVEVNGEGRTVVTNGLLCAVDGTNASCRNDRYGLRIRSGELEDAVFVGKNSVRTIRKEVVLLDIIDMATNAAKRIEFDQGKGECRSTFTPSK